MHYYVKLKRHLKRQEYIFGTQELSEVYSNQIILWLWTKWIISDFKTYRIDLFMDKRKCWYLDVSFYVIMMLWIIRHNLFYFIIHIMFANSYLFLMNNNWAKWFYFFYALILPYFTSSSLKDCENIFNTALVSRQKLIFIFHGYHS